MKGIKMNSILLLLLFILIGNKALAVMDEDIYVPLRATIEELGGIVNWVEETKGILVEKDDLQLEFQVGEKVYYLNNIRKEMKKEIVNRDGNTYILIKTIQQEFNLDENWMAEKIEELKRIELKTLDGKDKFEMVNISNSLLIEVDNYYAKNPLWVKENGSYINKIVGREEMFIRAGTLRKLIEVDKELQKDGYKLVVWVAYRGYELQENLREHYAYISGNFSGNGGLDVVARAGKSNHQRGSAVDVKVRRIDGQLITLPTKYLDFSWNSSVSAQQNNEIVRVMQNAFKKHGFKPYLREWWHFDDVDTSLYKHIRM